MKILFPQQQRLLHMDVCMISAQELLHIATANLMTKIDFDQLLAGKTKATANISDTQIDAYIVWLKTQQPSAPKKNNIASQFDEVFYKNLKRELRQWRNSCIKKASVVH